jgi:hypothetical protein
MSINSVILKAKTVNLLNYLTETRHLKASEMLLLEWSFDTGGESASSSSVEAEQFLEICVNQWNTTLLTKYLFPANCP